ncbi:MAG: hypothetical protein LVR00_01190 [Rhabdochlamydiaceae bacterium]
MPDILHHNPARDAVNAFIKIEAGSHNKSIDRITALKEIQTEIGVITDFIALLQTNEGKKIDVTKHSGLFAKVAELMPFALKGGEPGHFDEHALVNTIKEANGKYDTLVQCARDQVNNRNMKMGPETAQLDNLLKTLKEISDIMGRLVNSYADSGKNIVRNQRV